MVDNIKQGGKLDNLGITLSTHVCQFLRYAAMSHVSQDSETYCEMALNELAVIEDAIDRYKKGKKQSFQEEPCKK